jgi:hypothetical protein
VTKSGEVLVIEAEAGKTEVRWVMFRNLFCTAPYR